MSEGGISTGYLHVPIRRDLPHHTGPPTTAPPSDTPHSGASECVGEEGRVEDEATAGGGRGKVIIRPEGRHHLIDIHGLALFLRRSTRCLSCRAAFCLYVTGKISAHMTAVTQVKITCQKCNYTTSQSFSKPQGVPDSPSPQPSTPAHPRVPCPPPALPPDTSTPPVPSYPQKPRHQTVIRLLKEENVRPSDLVKGKETRRRAPLPALLPLDPIEKVWVKEDKGTPTPRQEGLEGEAMLGILDPLLTEWCHPTSGSKGIVSSSSSSSSSSPSSSSHVSTDGAGLPNNTVTTTTGSHGSPGSTQTNAIFPSLLTKPQEAPDIPSTTSMPNRLSPLQEDTLKAISSPPPVNPSLTQTNHPLITDSEGLLRFLAAAQSPSSLPLSPSVPQNNASPPTGSTQLLQAMEIKQKLERDLEESLRLVRRMIQLEPTSVSPPSEKSSKGRDVEGHEEDSETFQEDKKPLSIVQESVETSESVTDSGECSASGGRSKGRRDRGKDRNKQIKESTSNKPVQIKEERSIKREGGGGSSEDKEWNTRKRKRAKTNGSETEHCASSASPTGPLTPFQQKSIVERALHYGFDLVWGKGQEREGEGHQQDNQSLQRSNINLSKTSPTLDLSTLETLEQAQRIFENYNSSRKRHKKGSASVPSIPLHHHLNAILAGTDHQTQTQAPATMTDDQANLLNNLQENITQLVQTNSLRLALRSLVRKRASRSSRARNYVKISLGIGKEEEEEREREGVTTEEGEEGRSNVWGFNERLSSDSETDQEEGKLVIDTD